MRIHKSFVSAVAAAVAAIGCSVAMQPVEAGPVVIGTPVGSADSSGNIGARIRWGGTGFEAGIRRGSPTNGNYTNLNPAGTPAWVVGTPYKFETNWAWDTGIFSLSVDFDGSSTFGPGETVTQAFTGGPGTGASRQNFGFYGLRIFGDQTSSTATSQLTNLVVAGTPQADIVLAANTSLTTEYANSNQVLGDGNTVLDANTWNGLTLTGNITFTTPGTGTERPSWTISLLNPQPVPEPTQMVSVAGIGAAFGAWRLRKLRRSRMTAGEATAG
jgi:hypothetical protein